MQDGCFDGPANDDDRGVSSTSTSSMVSTSTAVMAPLASWGNLTHGISLSVVRFLGPSGGSSSWWAAYAVVGGHIVVTDAQ
jgi:hypothetical protein